MGMTITNFSQLIEEARKFGPKKVSIAAAEDGELLLALAEAKRTGLADPILFGDERVIRELAVRYRADISNLEIVNEPNHKLAVQGAVAAVKERGVSLIMNGKAQPGHLVRAALEPENQLRTGRLFTDVSVFEIPGFDRLILISDIGVVVSPTLEQKVAIVQNAIDVARALGVVEPKVAVLSATEMVNAKIPVSMDASNLSKMAQRGQIKGGLVDGPLSLDNSISPESARIKGIKSDVAGHADILIAPDVEAGNILAKAITYFAGGKMAGVVVGGRCPIVMPSRSDIASTKLASLALGVFLSGARP
jgi:phosphate butyryltransferase